jgi:hypothetical protein
METISCNVSSETLQALVILGRSVAGDNSDLPSNSKAVFYLAEEINYLYTDRFYSVCIMAPEEIIDTAYLLLDIVPAYPVTCMESLPGMDIVKF